MLSIMGFVALALASEGKTLYVQILLVVAAVAFVVEPLLVLVHELGHMVAARILNARPYAVMVGEAPWLIDRDAWGIRWRLSLYSHGGLTFHTPNRGPGARRNSMIITAAGPMTELLIFCAACIAFTSIAGPILDSPMKLVLMFTGLTSAMHFLTSAWPHTTWIGGVPYASDGAKILATLRGKWPDQGKNEAAMHYMRALFTFSDRDYATSIREAARAQELWPDPKTLGAIVVTRAAALSESGDPHAAIALLEPLHESGVEEPGISAGVEDNLAWAYLLLDDAQYIERALKHVATACEIVPWLDSFAITHACLLAVSATPENGRLADARRLLKGFSRQLSHQEAAYAELARGLVAAIEGDYAGARRHLERARQRHATCLPLQLLERRIPSR